MNAGRRVWAWAPLAALWLGCATLVPDAAGPLDWAAVGDERVPVLVTADPDGDARETKLWLVVVDAAGFVRTGEMRWHRNLQREPQAVLRIGGAAYPVRAEPIIDAALRDRVQQAFRAKYGWQDRSLGWFGNPDDANILRLDPR